MTATGKKRDSISYASQDGGEWLRTRSVREALAKVGALLERLTTFRRWPHAELAVEVAPGPALDALHDELERGPSELGLAERRARTFDAAALAARGVALDPLAGDALARFGPARIHPWGASTGPGVADRRPRYRLRWQRARCPTPDDWVAYADAHRRMMLDGCVRVSVVLDSRWVQWTDPATGALLPFQDPVYYPPLANAAHGCHVRVLLFLPACKMILDGRLPFERADAAFLAYYDRIADALGHPLPAKRFRAVRSNQRGTGTYERKLPFAR